MAVKKKPKRPASATIWMSRDSQGSATRKAYFWPKKPHGQAGEFYNPDAKEEQTDDLDHMDVDCGEFLRFCRIFGIDPPEPGELVKLNLKTQSVQTLSTRADIAERLRSGKRFDSKLMSEAAAWIETDNDSEDD